MRNRKKSVKSPKAKSEPTPIRTIAVRDGTILTPTELKEELEQKRGY